MRTLCPRVVDPVHGAPQRVWLERPDELAGLGIEALHSPVLPVGHAYHVLVLGESERVRYVEGGRRRGEAEGGNSIG